MPKLAYIEKNFRKDSLETIQRVNDIVDEYRQNGYSLTLRQVYYQLVARGFIPNNDRSYKNLGNLINDGRLAGYIDWYAITDRTRYLRDRSHWDTPSEIVRACADQFYMNHWEDMNTYIEVWVEKDALIDIVQQTCRKYDVPCFSCRGYVSQSEMWSAARRHIEKEEEGKKVIVLHFGDHDPSGIDMSRDIQERLEMFGADTIVKRLALSMEQIEQFNPPPNPAKTTDARYKSYIEQYGYESWELDALDPQTLSDLITEGIEEYLDNDVWEKVEEEIRNGENRILDVANLL